MINLSECKLGFGLKSRLFSEEILVGGLAGTDLTVHGRQRARLHNRTQLATNASKTLIQPTWRVSK